MANEVDALTESNFDGFMEAHAICVVIFSATWCKPCVSFRRTIADLAESEPEVGFGWVDIEEAESLASEFAIKSVPTVMLFREHVVLSRETGEMTAGTLRDLIHQAAGLDMDEVRAYIAAQHGGEAPNK